MSSLNVDCPLQMTRLLWLHWLFTGACVNTEGTLNSLVLFTVAPRKWPSFLAVVSQMRQCLHNRMHCKWQYLCPSQGFCIFLMITGTSGLEEYSSRTKEWCDTQVFIITIQWPYTAAVGGNMNTRVTKLTMLHNFRADDHRSMMRVFHYFFVLMMSTLLFSWQFTLEPAIAWADSTCVPEPSHA